MPCVEQLRRGVVRQKLPDSVRAANEVSGAPLRQVVIRLQNQCERFEVLQGSGALCLAGWLGEHADA